MKLLKWLYIVQIKKTMKFLNRCMLGKILKMNNIVQEYVNKNSLTPHRDEKGTSIKIL